MNYIELNDLVDKYNEGSLWAKFRLWFAFGSVESALREYRINRNMQKEAEIRMQQNIKKFAQKTRGTETKDRNKYRNESRITDYSSNRTRVTEDDDGSFVDDVATGMVIGSLLSNDNDSPSSTSPDASGFSGFGGAEDNFGGGGAGGSWDTPTSDNYS